MFILLFSNYFKAFVAEWLVCVTLNLKVTGACSNLKRRQKVANSRLIILFLIAYYEAAFCRVLASVCEAKLCLCVYT